MFSPVEHLVGAGRVYPNAWRQADEFRADMGKGLTPWPAWCFLPLGGWHAIVCQDLGVQTLRPELAADVSRLGALGAWRVSQGIYKFHPDVLAALASTPVAGPIPCEVMLRLKEWCVYIETPHLKAGSLYGPLDGFWAHLESDANTGRKELRLLLNGEDSLSPIIIHLGDWSIVDGVQRFAEEACRQGQTFGINLGNNYRDKVEELAEFASPLVSMLLYLCSDEAEVGGNGTAVPSRPAPKRTKNGWRLFPPDSPRVWNVGETLGEAIAAGRRAQASHAHSGPRPHIRRAHWHGYWTGPKAAQRFTYRWLAPIAVAMRDDDDTV